MSQFNIWMRGTMGWGDAGATARTHPCGEGPRREGIVGFIGNAMGLDKYRDVSQLADLDNAVKSIKTEILQKGELFRDFQVVNGEKTWCFNSKGKEIGPELPKMGGGFTRKSFVKEVWYRADAEYVVTVVCDDDWLDRITEALRHPINVPYFGKKCCMGSYRITEVER